MNTTKEQPPKTENKGAETSAPATKVAEQNKTVVFTEIEKWMIRSECVKSIATKTSSIGSVLSGIKLH